jgi:hypothetical protein
MPINNLGAFHQMSLSYKKEPMDMPYDAPYWFVANQTSIANNHILATTISMYSHNSHINIFISRLSKPM